MIDDELTPDRWASYAPHEQYGNIYSPYHIGEHGSMARYAVFTAQDEQVTQPAKWMTAILCCQKLNAGETCPVLESLLVKQEATI